MASMHMLHATAGRHIAVARGVMQLYCYNLTPNVRAVNAQICSVLRADLAAVYRLAAASSACWVATLDHEVPDNAVKLHSRHCIAQLPEY
jgi:hypothetical protein